MHTHETATTRFFHNGDFSGDVTMQAKDTGQDLRVPFEELKSLVAEYVRQNRIAQLEQMSDDELLDLAAEPVGRR